MDVTHVDNEWEQRVYDFLQNARVGGYQWDPADHVEMFVNGNPVVGRVINVRYTFPVKVSHVHMTLRIVPEIDMDMPEQINGRARWS